MNVSGGLALQTSGLGGDDSPAPGEGRFGFRPFGGQKSDLDFDFRAPDRPRLVTEILAACMVQQDGSILESEEIWSFSVSRRIACLLRLAAASGSLRCAFPCPGEGCGQVLEIDLPLGEILGLQRRAETSEVMEWQDGAAVWRLRRPTGNDQRQWNADVFADAPTARQAMVHSLITPDPLTRPSPVLSPSEGTPVELSQSARGLAHSKTLREDDAPGKSEGFGVRQSSGAFPRAGIVTKECPPDLVETLEAHLEEFDPLVAFSVRLVCPQCGVERNIPVDLETLALGELERVQRQLLWDTHRLAMRYHWSESEILGLSPTRRTRYLKLIEAEEGS